MNIITGALAALVLTLSFPASSLAETAMFPILKVNVERFSSFSSSERTKAEHAMGVIEAVINSEEFRERILQFSYKDPTTGVVKNEFSNNTMNGITLSNEEILEKIYEAQENFRPESNSQIDLNITLFNPKFRQRNLIGYTYPTSDTIWVNRKFYSKFQYSQIAANFTHEWLHKIGFGHDFQATRRRPYSVPYAIGSIMSELGAKLNR